MAFSELGLDSVLTQCVKRCGFLKPTQIQQQSIPAVLRGEDVLALSKTGTGKTMAYLLPILQKLLTYEEQRVHPWTVVVLVPTKELIIQVCEEFRRMMRLASIGIRVSSILDSGSSGVADVMESGIGPVVICTPRQISSLLQEGTAKDKSWIGNVEMLVVDEADLILSYGYDADMKFISPKIPSSCQCFLASATRSSDLDVIVKLVMQNPKRIDLLGAEWASTTAGSISHYHFECLKEEKALHLLVFLQFQSVDQPVMIFVNTIHNGYRLRLFLDCFRIDSGLLHRELPQATRQQLIEDFNKGKSKVFIVVDDLQSKFVKEDKAQRKKRKDPKKKTPKEAEFGVARGLDFKNVKTVVNFDPPQTVNGYLHRVGRTGRAGRSGLALTFLTEEDEGLGKEINRHLNETRPSEMDKSGEEVFRKFVRYDPHQVGALKYRASDVLRSLHRQAIAAARKRDIHRELLRSTELESYFEAHPEEKKLLQTNGMRNDLKRKFNSVSKLPSYIVPDAEHLQAQTSVKQPRSVVPKIDPLSQKRSSRGHGRKKRRKPV